jgi:hypothetical protein
MGGGCFKGYVVNKYGSYDVPGSGCKWIYIHCDLIDHEGCMIVTLTIQSYFVISFSPCLNIGGFVHINNFDVTFHKKLERGD